MCRAAQLYASELQAAVLAGHRAFPGPEQRGAPMGHSHQLMNPPGGTTYWAGTGFHTGRGTGPNGRARSNSRRATGPQHTSGVFQPLRSLPEGAPMFCVVSPPCASPAEAMSTISRSSDFLQSLIMGPDLLLLNFFQMSARSLQYVSFVARIAADLETWLSSCCVSPLL